MYSSQTGRFLRAEIVLFACFTLFLAVMPVSAQPDQANTIVRIACVGDSITYGLRIDDREQHHYPAVLNRLLGDGPVVLNAGVSGATLLKQGDLPYWQTAAFRDATAFEPHVVIIKLGTNDTKHRNAPHRDAFADDLRALIDHFTGLPSAPSVWVCYPTPMYGVFRLMGDRTLRREIIPAIKQVAKEKGVPIIDLYDALDNAPGLFPDGVHPNAEGAEKIAHTVSEAIRDTVRELTASSDSLILD